VATEIVEIVIRERGGKATSKQIRSVGRSAGSVKKKILGLVAALGILAGIRGFLGVTKAAIDTSAAFEQYGVRLSALLGNQREANKALDTFVDLASRTPFAVSQIVEGAATLGSVALGNRERLEELTATAANLAAITGLSFQQAAGNLQRAMSAGIASADLFRERGVKGLIESIAGIPDATELSLAETAAAFEKVFGANGTFGNAAEDLSKTLGGAISNLGDAATNVRKALGDAFRGPVINALRDALIPFLQDLEEILEDNEGAIQAFARDGLQVAIKAFALFVKGGVKALEIMNQLRDAGNKAQGILLRAEAKKLQKDAPFNLFAIGAAEEQGDEALLATLVEKGRARQERLNEIAEELVNIAVKTADAKEDFAEFLETIEKLETATDKLFAAGGGLSGTAPKIETEVDLPTGETPEEIAAKREATEKLLDLNKKITLQALRRKDPIEAEIFLLGEMANELIKAAQAAGDVEAATAGVLQIQEQILALQQKQTAEAAKKAEKTAKDAKDASEDLARDISGALESSFGSAIRGAIEGEGFDAMGLLAKTGADLLDDALSRVFDDLGKSFAGLFAEGGPLSGLGGAVGAGLQAGIGAALSFIPGAIADTEASITNSLVKSAAGATQAEAQRGVIAGNTSLPIFQVGESMEAALAETESKLDLSNEFLAGILEAVRASVGGVASGGGVGQSPGEILATQSPLLT